MIEQIQPIQADEIHIHLLKNDSGRMPGPATHFLPFLTPDERDQYLRFGSDSRRREFLLSRLLVRSLLAGYLNRDMNGLKFSYCDRGKPFVEGAELKFNLSHTDGLIACSFGRREVGIDVEKMDAQKRPSWPLLANRYFSPEENNYLFSQPQETQPLAFFRIFTAKEAFGKATGRGINIRLTDFTVPMPPADRTWIGPWEFFQETFGPVVYCLTHVAKNPGNVPLKYEIHTWDEEGLMDFFKNSDALEALGVKP